MKLTTVLNEIANFDNAAFANFNQQVSLEQAAAIVRERCMSNVPHPLYRGLGSSSSPAFAVDSSKIRRTSRDNNNHYTQLMSGELQCWEQYPPRDRATICSLSHQVAAQQYGQGDFYYVYPEDGTPIGLAPSYDIWESFKNLIGIIDDDNIRTILDLMEHLEQFKPTMQQVLTMQTKQVLNTKVAANGTVRSFLEQYMNPRFNGFKLVSSTTALPNGDAKNEVWFSGKSVMVYHENIHQFYRLLQQ